MGLLRPWHPKVWGVVPHPAPENVKKTCSQNLSGNLPTAKLNNSELFWGIRGKCAVSCVFKCILGKNNFNTDLNLKVVISYYIGDPIN